MPRPITLFTGQWADLPLETLCAKAKAFGYDGLELACWGDHFEVDKALKDKNYVTRKWEVLSDHGLSCWAISAHLVGQAICDSDRRAAQVDSASGNLGRRQGPKTCASGPRPG